jgi:hypothetical protein
MPSETEHTFQRHDFAGYQLGSSHTGRYLRYDGDTTQPFVSNGTSRTEDDMTNDKLTTGGYDKMTTQHAVVVSSIADSLMSIATGIGNFRGF